MKNNKQTVELLKGLTMLFPINLIETFHTAGKLDGNDVVELCRYAKAVGYAYEALGNELLARSYKCLSQDIDFFKDVLIACSARDLSPEKYIEYLKKVLVKHAI